MELFIKFYGFTQGEDQIWPHWKRLPSRGKSWRINEISVSEGGEKMKL